MAHMLSSSLGSNRSPSTQYYGPSMQIPIKSTAATADLYDLPSSAAQTPPPAYDLGALSMYESSHNSSGNQAPAKPPATGSTPQAQQDDSSRCTNARRASEGPRRPMFSARSNSEFLPYSAYYYLIHTRSRQFLDQPIHVNYPERVGEQLSQCPDSASDHPRATVKRKVNKLRKPRPLPPHLAHQTKVDQVYQQSENPDRTSIRPPLTNASRVNSQNAKIGIFKRAGNIKIGVTTSPSNNEAAGSILPQRQSSRKFRDEKRMALVNATDAVPQGIPSNLNICLHCKFDPSNQNQFNINLNVNHPVHLHSCGDSDNFKCSGIHQFRNGRSFFT